MEAEEEGAIAGQAIRKDMAFGCKTIPRYLCRDLENGRVEVSFRERSRIYSKERCNNYVYHGEFVSKVLDFSCIDHDRNPETGEVLSYCSQPCTEGCSTETLTCLDLCEDEDSDNDPAVIGTVLNSKGGRGGPLLDPRSDSCTNEGKLKQVMCGNEGVLSSVITDCPDGTECREGACVEAPRCNPENLELCDTQEECTAQLLQWYDGTCYDGCPEGTAGDQNDPYVCVEV